MMTKAEIIKRVNELYPKLTVKETHTIVCGLFNFMADSLSTGKRIEVRGFGAFSLKSRAAGMVRNPRHGVAVESPARHVVYFRPGKELAERANRIYSGAK
jgi:integration host factor subunit beta